MANKDRPSKDDLGLTQELEIDRVCLRFEEELRSGSKPLIEQFLGGKPEPERCQLLRQLLLLELEYRKGLGASVAAEECLERFPEDQSLVRLVLAEHARGAKPEYGHTQSFTYPSSGTPRVGGQSESSLSDSSHHGRFLPGTELASRYRIVSLLGEGGMGEVYRADDLQLGQTVALKFLPKELANDAKRLEYFRREVRLTRQVSHPNVCRVYDIGEVDGQQFLSMEYIDGEDLKSLLRRIGRLPKDKGIQTALQLCGGIAAAHDKGVLHRDLKPANVMIDGRGQVRITDFGLATVTDEPNSGESFVGTPAYMAPEQLQRAETHVQSDIYSLGLVLYEIFTGEPAHKSISFAGTPSGEDGSAPSNPSDLVADMDPSVERIIMRCLDREPSNRPRSVAAIAAALPGGDPLAAALAAGETPSPALVAASGEAGWLTPGVAAGCLAGVAVGLILVAAFAQRAYLVNLAPLELKPAALENKAQELIRDLGYSKQPASCAYGFVSETRELYDIARLDIPQGVENRWDLLKTGHWPGVRFWYRQSPNHMFTDRLLGGFAKGYNRGRVGFQLPEWTPGMIGLQLDPRGKLRLFRAVPPETTVFSSGPRIEPEWSTWLTKDHLGFSLDELSSTSGWHRTPPDAYDCLKTWQGTWPNSDEPLYVEAASYRGRPVYLEVLHPSKVAKRTPRDSANSPQRRRPLNLYVRAVRLGFVLVFLIDVVAVLLAWRNLRLGRGDRRGAARIAGYVLAISIVIWAFHASHVASIGMEQGNYYLGLATATLSAAMFWVYYTAGEPFVRRFWPGLLVSWTRLLDGRFRDPRIGRDLLVGSLTGTFSLAIGMSIPWLKLSGPIPTPGGGLRSLTLLGPTVLAGAVLEAHFYSLLYAFLVLLMLLLARGVLRSEILGAGLVVGILTTGHALANELPPVAWAFCGLSVLVGVCVLVRFGLVAYLAWTTTIGILGLPITTDATAFYFKNGLFGIGLVAALALYGAWTSTGAKPLFRD